MGASQIHRGSQIRGAVKFKGHSFPLAPLALGESLLRAGALVPSGSLVKDSVSCRIYDHLQVSRQ